MCNKSVSNNILYRGVDLIKMYICCVDVTMELSFRLCVRERDVFLEQVSDLLCYIYMHHFYSFLQFWSTSALTVYDQNTFGSQLFWHIVLLFMIWKVVVKNGLLTKLRFGLSTHCRDWPDYEFRSECA